MSVASENSDLSALLSARAKGIPVAKPEALDVPVLAVLRHCFTNGQRYAVLYAVSEDDCDWRSFDDDSELSYDWDVISWIYLPYLNLDLRERR